jgi:hypothetical protein
VQGVVSGVTLEIDVPRFSAIHGRENDPFRVIRAPPTRSSVKRLVGNRPAVAAAGRRENAETGGDALLNDRGIALQRSREGGQIVKKWTFILTLVLSLVIVSSVFVPGALAKKKQIYPRVIPPQAMPYGASCGEWGARWWQWVLAQPADTNPLLDATGEFAAVGQSGPVWFLCGTPGTPTAERTVTVPAGKALYMPFVNVEGCEADTPGYDWAAVLALVDDFIDTVSAADLTVDGRVLHIGPAYRTGLFISDYTVPENNLFGLPAGHYAPVAYDGYYAMLAPLPPGSHTLVIHGAAMWFGSPFELTVTYHLTVK